MSEGEPLADHLRFSWRASGAPALSSPASPRTTPTDHDTPQGIRFLIGSRRSGRQLRTARSGYTGISVEQINDIVVKCGRLAGVRHPKPERRRLNPHLFRHSFVRNAIARGW